MIADFESFSTACYSGNLAEVEELAQTFTEFDAIDHSDNTMLMSAAFSRNVDIVRFLLDRGAPVNQRSDMGRTALHAAAFSENNVPVLRLLLDHGADLHAVCDDDKRPIDDAGDGGCPHNCRFLWEAGVESEDVLLAATRAGMRQLALDLLVDGVLVDSTFVDQNQLTMDIIFNVGEEAAEMCHDFTPLGYAVARNDPVLCAALIACGASVDKPCVKGERPITFAVNQYLLHVARLLVAAGAVLPASGPVFKPAKLRAAAKEIAKAGRYIDGKRREILLQHAWPACIGLQNLRFPALVTLTILDALLPGRLHDVVPMHTKWKVITTIKHFHQ